MADKNDKKSNISTTQTLENLDEYVIELEMSPVKREKLVKQRKESLRRRLRESLPVLTKTQIRRFRLPFHESLLLDLSESGHKNTADFIQQLLEHQEMSRQQAGPGSVFWIRPQLKKSQENLSLLAHYLTKAEEAHMKERFHTYCDEMLELCVHYAFGSDDWWWLGEQLLYQCVSMEYPEDFQRQQAIAYFIMGKYLVENGKKPEAGRYYLDLAREMAKGKSWNCSKYFKTKQDIVFIECCRLLHTTLMEEATNLLQYDPAAAIEICNVARKRAAEACDDQGTHNARILKSKCELLLNDTSNAIITVTQALNRAIRRKNINEICEAKIYIALAYLQHEKHRECLEHLKELKALAEEYDLGFYLGQAYRFMGEYYLKQHEPYEATPLLMMAFYLFHDFKDLKRREKVRTWAAISAGDELFPAFIRLIQSCEDPDGGHESLMKLVSWIDEKEFFWTQQSKFSFSFTSIQQSVFENPF